MMNPLYIWFLQNQDKLGYHNFNPNIWYNMIEELAKIIEEYCNIKIPTIRKCKIKYCVNHYPIVYARNYIASCLISDNVFKDIIKYSNGYVFDIGCGSAYNSLVLKKLGCEMVYAIDTLKNNNWEVEFYPVDYDNYDDQIIKQIVINDGVALYIWPWRRYYHLDRWLKNGGNKVITIGCFSVRDYFFRNNNPDVREEDIPYICPPFPPEEYKNNFTNIDEYVMESFNMDDASTVSTIQFWKYNLKNV